MNVRFLLTGGPGFGKSSIIDELERLGYQVKHEIARQIILESIQNKTMCNPWQDIVSFSERVLEERISQYNAGSDGVWFYDRGLPDIPAFMLKDKREIQDELWRLCKEYRFEKKVFITPPWEAIFHKDNERKEDFVAAIKVHKMIERVYTELEYELIPVPMGSIKDRAKFVLDQAGIPFKTYY